MCHCRSTPVVDFPAAAGVVASRFSGSLSTPERRQSRFPRRRCPRRHSDECATEQPGPSPSSRSDLGARLNSTSSKNKRVLSKILLDLNRLLRHPPHFITRNIRLMKTCSLIAISAVFMVLTRLASATQADDTMITITGITAGATPFISKLTLQVSSTTVLKNIQFAIDPKPGSVTRPLSGTYSNDYLVSRGFEHPPEVILPVYGLYAGYTNTVRLTYRFLDGSSKQAFTSITTPTFDDQGCGYNNPTKFQPRTNSTHLSYDYIFDNSACGDFSPVILDSDGALRWVSPFRFSSMARYMYHGAARCLEWILMGASACLQTIAISA